MNSGQVFGVAVDDMECGSIARRSKVGECTKTVGMFSETASVARRRRHSAFGDTLGLFSDIGDTLGISSAAAVHWIDNGWIFRRGTGSRWRSVSLSNSLSARTNG